jgi:hypothetical protein
MNTLTLTRKMTATTSLATTHYNHPFVSQEKASQPSGAENMLLDVCYAFICTLKQN